MHDGSKTAYEGEHQVPSRGQQYHPSVEEGPPNREDERGMEEVGEDRRKPAALVGGPIRRKPRLGRRQELPRAEVDERHESRATNQPSMSCPHRRGGPGTPFAGVSWIPIRQRRLS